MEIKVKMPGHIRFYNVKEGDMIELGAQIASMEALRMEHKLAAPVSGTVKKIVVPINERISAGTVIMVIE